MPYTIRTLPPPTYITVYGLNGPEPAKAPDGWVQPQNYVRKIWESDNIQLWEDVNGTATNAEIFAACPGIRAWQEKTIRMVGAGRLAAIAQPYSAEERETWPYQREECLAYNRDNSTLTPFCDAIALQRGVPRGLFLTKVKQNMDLFSMVSAGILGQQQALIDRIYTVQTVAELLAITWE